MLRPDDYLSEEVDAGAGLVVVSVVLAGAGVSAFDAVFAFVLSEPFESLPAVELCLLA